MSDAEKKPYYDMSKKDEERYKSQLAELKEKGYFTTADGKKSTEMDLSPRLKYGPTAVLPKKPLSSYIIFTKEKAGVVKEEKKCSHV